MKRSITIAIIILLALGLGYYLFTLSPDQGNPGNTRSLSDFDTTTTVAINQPREFGSGDYALGNPSAKNTMIVYEDFQCPACANYASIVEQFPSALQDTKVVFRHYPLPQHTNAIPAAYAAEAAGVQGKFWEMYRQLYITQNQWAELPDPAPIFVQLAQTAGVPDINKFQADMSNKIGKDKIQADITESLSLKIQGTPSLYYNGQPLQLGSLEQVKAQAEKLYK